MRIVLCKGQILGPISGADETLVTYAIELQRAGHAVSVLLMYLPLAEDQYYQRLLKAGVPVSWIASKFAHTSLGTGRKLAYKMFEAFPTSKPLIRRRAQRVVTLMATRYAQQCREFFKQQNADLIHIITPDPSAMVMIRAGYDAGVPVIYQELGLPYQPPDFESYYQQFTSVLPLCTVQNSSRTEYQTMTEPLLATDDPLVLDFVEWIAREPRLYADVLDTWRTSCPRLTVWEDAVDRGLVTRTSTPGRGTTIEVTPCGNALLRQHRGH